MKNKLPTLEFSKFTTDVKKRGGSLLFIEGKWLTFICTLVVFAQFVSFILRGSRTRELLTVKSQ